MKRLLLAFSTFILLMIVWYGESRKFYCIGDRKCVTVWKTYNSVCYVIPGKYYGFLKPSSINFIETTNLSDLDIIWKENSSDLIASVDDNSKIINQSKFNAIQNYNLNKEFNDSLYTYFDGKYHRYKKSIKCISIFVKENYATDIDGKHL